MAGTTLKEVLSASWLIALAISSSYMLFNRVTLSGALVGFDEYEAKQPQLNPTPKVFDPQALKNARPDRKEALTIYAGQPNVETPETIQIRAIGSIGFVTVTIA